MKTLKQPTFDQLLRENVPILTAFMDDETVKQIKKATYLWLEQKRHRPYEIAKEGVITNKEGFKIQAFIDQELLEELKDE